MLHLNPELAINEPVEPNPDVPIPVQQHVSALDTYASELLRKCELSSEAAAFARLFAKRHDAGYGAGINFMQTEYAADILERALDAVDSQVDPQYVIDYLQRNADNYMAARVIGHGVLGLIENTRYFEKERQLSRQRALGLASILSAHHSGFPITMVSGFLPESAAIPKEARSAFFIDDGGENPEVVRHKLAELGARELGISSEDALYAAVLGYALDRLTAGSTPDDLQYRSGSIELHGGEVIQKKYGLVAGDLNRREHNEPLVPELFNVVLQRITAEAEAAVAAADAADAPDIRQFIEAQQVSIHAATHNMQRQALVAMYRLNLMGRFSDLRKEREKLLLHARFFDDPSIFYALAAYDAIINSIPQKDS
jgi:hypothetical protein